MRISSSLFFQTGLNSINSQQADLLHIFKQIGSGQRMVTPSDDPLAAAEAINVAQSQSMNLRFAENRQVAKSNLGNEENVLNSATTLMQGIKTRLVEIGNGAMSDADRLTLQGVLKEMRTSLLGLANSTDGNGQYLFSGNNGNAQPFDSNGVYHDELDLGKRLVQVDQTRQISSGDTGLDIFARATPGVTKYLTSSSASGTAVVGNAAITDSSLLDQEFRYRIEFTSDTSYDIHFEHVDPGNTDPLPTTMSGTLNGFDNQIIKLPASDGTPNGGVQINISGVPSTGDTFVVEPANSADMNVFKTLDNMIDVLSLQHSGSQQNQAQFRNVLNASMQRIDINYDNMLTVRSSVGARFNEIEALDDSGSLSNLNYRAHLSRLEDLDYYQASTQLELRRSALEGASLAFLKIQGTSMFNLRQ